LKKAIYISSFIGISFILASFIGFIFDLNITHLSLPLGLGLLLVVALPLFLIDHSERTKKRKKTLQTHSLHKSLHPDQTKPVEKRSVEAYPTFSDRKSGLEWGGGNIHGSIGKRGSRKRFLKN